MHPSRIRRPRSTTSRTLGMPCLLEELTGEPVAGYWGRDGYAPVLADIGRLYADCSRMSDQFVVVLCEPIDRLQQTASLSAVGLHGAHEYATTVDVVLDAWDAAVRLQVLRLVLERTKDLFVTHDPKKALVYGEQPVPMFVRKAVDGTLYLDGTPPPHYEKL